MRSLLLAGYGTGASEARVLTVTRNRQEIGGMSPTARRALTAERTSLARERGTGALARFQRGVERVILIIGVPVLVVRVLRMLR